MADYKGGFDTTGDILLNFDITRTSKYTESFVIPATKKYRLKYVPKDLSIESLGFTVVNSKDPQANYIGIDYAPDNEYQAASGIIYFNVGDVGRLISVTYVPVGSRIDANDLNPALQWVHAYRNALYTKVELATSGSARVNWDNIINAPAIVTPDKSGFMSFTDKRALDTIDPTKKPFGSVLIGSDSVAPTAWGGPLELGIEGNVWPKFLGSKVIFMLDPATKGLVDDKTLAALAGTSGVPSSTNKFVTEEDPRIKNPGIAIHGHTIQDVDLLPGALSSKSDKGHKHTTADITGLDGTLGSFAAAGHKHTIADTTGLQAALDDKAPAIHRHTDLEQQLATKASIGHGHNTSEIDGLQDMVAGIIAGQPQDNNAVDVRGLSGDLANMDAIVEDGIISGFGARIDPNNAAQIDIAAGKGYAGGLRVTYSGGQVGCLAAGEPVKTIGTASPGLGPAVVGEYPNATPITYTFEVVTANRNPGMHLDLAIKITSSDGAKNETQNYQAYDYQTLDSTVVILETGFGVGFTMTPTGVYTVGDKWTVSVATDCHTFLYINGRSNAIYKKATAKTVTTPPVVAGCWPLAMVDVTAAVPVSVVDKRGSILGVAQLKDVKGITKPAGDSSKSLATTEFVTQAITATNTAVITHTVQIFEGTRLAAPPGVSLANATNVALRVIIGGRVVWGFSYIDYFEDGSGSAIRGSYAFCCDHTANQIVCLSEEGPNISEVKIYVTGGK